MAGFFGSPDAPEVERDSLRANSLVRILDILGEGEIRGLVGGARGIWLDGTPLLGPNGNRNFEGVRVAVRNGTIPQTAIEIASQAETDRSVGQPLKYNTPVSRTINNPNCSAVRVRVALPQGLIRVDNSGDQRGTSVIVDIRLGSGGAAPTLVGRKVIDGKTMAAYAVDYLIPLSGVAPWTLQLSRVSPDSEQLPGDQTRRWATDWDGYTEIVGANLTYQGTAVVALEFDSSKFGTSIPQRSYLVDGLFVGIPSNYDPVNRTYNGIWNGVLVRGWTDNPAWILYEIITNNRWGLGDYIAPELVDKWGFYSIAQYCDELVPDLKGGYEPRFTCGASVYDEQSAWNLLSDFASIFRGQVYYMSGAVIPVADRYSDPVMTITPANVVGDAGISYAEAALDARHSVIEVQWLDPSQNYESRTEIVEDAEMIRRYGRRVKSVRAFATRSRGQAIRVGRSILAAEKWESGTAEWIGGFDHAWLQPGHVVLIADPLIAGDRMGGRCRALTVSRLTIDDELALTPGIAYSITYTATDGSLQTRGIAAYLPGDANSLPLVDLDQPMTVLPINGAVFAVGGADVQPRRYRVLSVEEEDEHLFRVVAMRSEAGKYAWIDLNVPFTPPPDSKWLGALQAPTNLQALDVLYRTTDGVRARFDVSWSPPVDPRVQLYEVETMAPGMTAWTTLAQTPAVSIAITNGVVGAWRIRVRSTASLIEPSEWVELAHAFGGLNAPPPDVQAIWANEFAETLQLEWIGVTVLDLARYEIRMVPLTGGAVWERGQIVAPTVPVDAVQWMLPLVPGFYMIKAVDQLGNYSVNEATVRVSDSFVAGDLIDTITDRTPWAGTRVDTTTFGNDLILARDVVNGGFLLSGTYELVPHIVMTAVDRWRFATVIDAVGRDPTNVLASWVPLASAKPLGGAVNDKWAVAVDIATSTDNIAWSAWTPIGGYATGRYFKFRARLLTFDNRISPAVDSITVNAYRPR